MNQDNKKINDDFDMKDVSDKNINYVKSKNATTVSNDEFVIKDLSFEDFKFDAKLEGGNATINTDNSSSKKASDDNNTTSGQASDSKDTNAPSNTNNSNSDTSNDNDMQDVSDEMLENDNNKSNPSNNSNEGGSSVENKDDKDNDLDSKDKNLENKQDDKENKDENKEESDDKKNKEDSDGKENKDESNSKDKKDDPDSKDNKDDKDSDKKEDDKDKDKNKKDEPNDKDKEKKHDGLDDKDKNDPNKKENDKKDNNPNNNNKENQNKNSNNQADNESKNNSKKPDNNPANNGNKENSKKNNNDKKKVGNDKKPNPYQRKKDDLKKKWDNRPKTPKDFAKRAGNGIKNKAKDAAGNSAPGRAVNKVKETVQKTKETVEKTKKVVKHIIKHWHVYAIVASAGVVVFALIIFLTLTATGVNGNVNNEGAEEKYSEKDQETLKELKDIFESHPGVDGTVAMATVALPYYEVMINGNVKGYLNAPTPSDKDEDTEDSDSTETTTDSGGSDIEETDTVDDDSYLAVFRKKKVRKRLNKLLEEFGKGEDSYKSYLKDSYFKSDGGYSYLISRPSFITGYNGYKKMFADIKDKYKDKQEELKDAIIENIYEISSLFAPYVYEAVSCSSSSTSLGYSEAGDIIKGEPVVVLKDTGDPDNVKGAKSLYGTDANPMQFARYVMGVVYAEVGGSINDEAVVKAQMIAAKSFTLGRTQGSNGQNGSIGMGREFDQTGDKTIFYMRANVNDQDFCDVYEGCRSGTYSWSNRSYMSGSGDAKPALSKAQLTNLEKWWNDTVTEYVYDESNKVFAGQFYNDYNDACNPGSCLAQSVIEKAPSGTDYKTLLYKYAFSESRFTEYNSDTKQVSSVASVCSAVSSGVCGIDGKSFIYYDQKDYSNPFCGGSGYGEETIAASGCGTTSMAMVINNLTDYKVDPIVTSNNAANMSGACTPSGGTNFVYFREEAKRYGLEYSIFAQNQKGIEDAKKILNSGGLVIANVGPASPFTSGGHYIVIRSITSDDKVYVADPNHHELFDTPYPLSDFINKGWITYGWFGFTSKKSASIKEKYCGSTVIDENGFKKVKYDINEIKSKYGEQAPASCYSTALTYGAWMAIKYDRADLKHETPGPSGSNWKATYLVGNSDLDVYKKIVEQIDLGKPVVVHGARDSANPNLQHWVTVIGYKNGVSADKLTLSDVLILDPWGCEEKKLSDSLVSFRTYNDGVPTNYEMEYWE